MRSKVVILCVTIFLLLLALNGSATSQPPDQAPKIDCDTIDIAILYTTAYPGTEEWVEVWMKNPVPVTGYNFELIIEDTTIARFVQDDTGSCFVQSWFPWITCECLNENCTWIYTEGRGPWELPPRPNYDSLFKIHTDFCCIPDSSTNRSAIVRFGDNSYVYGRNGDPLPLHCSSGEVFVWWSVPGDANGDSLVNLADAVFLVNYLFIGGPEPCVCEAADCNNDSAINIADVVYLVNYLFINGPAPVPGSISCWYQDCWP